MIFSKRRTSPACILSCSDDLGEQRHEVEHFLNIDAYLEKHRPVEEATNPDLLESVNRMLRPELENILSAKHFALEAIEQTKLRTIPVEGRTQLGLFEVTCTLQTTHSADTRSGAKATSVGSCEISLPSKVSDVQFEKTRLSWRDESGSTRQDHIAHLRSGRLSIGTTPASLIGPSGSSTFRLSINAMSMSLAGSCFSSKSAPGPFHHGIRGRGGTIC